MGMALFYVRLGRNYVPKTAAFGKQKVPLQVDPLVDQIVLRFIGNAISFQQTFHPLKNSLRGLLRQRTGFFGIARPPVETFDLIGQDDTAYGQSIWYGDFKRISFTLTGNRTENSQPYFIHCTLSEIAPQQGDGPLVRGPPAD